jgi:hypothetical protein
MRKHLFDFIRQLFLALLIWMSSIVMTCAADNNMPEIKEYLQTPKLIGTGPLRYLGFKVYDASYFVNANPAHDNFAIRIEYSRKIKSSDLLKATLKGMNQIGAPEFALSKWGNFLEKMYPDVDEGHTITAIYTGNGNTLFFHNGKPIGKANDLEFAKYFFGIWFDPQTNSPDLRHRLLGENCAPPLISTACVK